MTVGPCPPLPTLLSQVLVAFTIECDNEFERRMPHRTSATPLEEGARGPRLISLAMWSNFMRFVGDAGVPLRELEGPARMTNLAGLQRWGYITLTRDPSDARPDSPRRDWLVHATSASRRAREIWQELPGTIEGRWEERYGAETVYALRAALQALADRLDPSLPYYLPVVRHSMATQLPDRARRVPGGWVNPAPDLDLATLLSRVLLAFTLDFERDAPLSLPISANTLRVLDEDGVPLRDLLRLTGVSKEAISMSIGFLARNGFGVVAADPAGGRSKLVRLTPSGRRAQNEYHRHLGEVEDRWVTRFGAEAVRALRTPLEGLALGHALLDDLEPSSTGWRAAVRRPHTLPHHPMVLHRGGWPDGS